MTETKSWYQSKTVWFNLAVLLLTVAMFVLQSAQQGQVTLPIPPEWVALLAGVGNLILRFITNKPLST